MDEILNFYGKQNSLVKLWLIDFGIQLTGFIFSCILKTEKFYDLLGSISFIILTYLNLKWSNIGHPRQYIQTACISIWTLRLGLFLFVRILKRGKDRRFEKIINNPSHLFAAWILQGVWVIVTLLPSILCIKSPQQKSLGWKDYIGWGIWTLGFLIEVIADYQKASFRNDEANKDKFINSGLWSLSRHPNYFGEILLWFGLYISASSVFHSVSYLTVLCPIFDYLLITQISGIPPLEKYGMFKWGRNPNYQRYVKETPLLVPFF